MPLTTSWKLIVREALSKVPISPLIIERAIELAEGMRGIPAEAVPDPESRKNAQEAYRIGLACMYSRGFMDACAGKLGEPVTCPRCGGSTEHYGVCESISCSLWRRGELS